METSQSEQLKEKPKVKKKKRENSLRDLWITFSISAFILSASRRTKERKEGKMCLMNLWLKTSQTRRRKHIQAQKPHRLLNKMNQNKITLRCSIIKMAGVRNQERILKAARKNTESIKGNFLKTIC